ncbi:uncharacterized protein LOC129755200 [Uranotaenia lowii]|uniref:uncharacterized protein LOC129755200 n=1 Tax=Uranotaenia lowii TaxID=190385 RepID=UPI00247A2A67|nr:uncharacterized protein LOC129755200 [Uranotaenia lowii]XP_055607550.1 uncharacterized protein LOC129755200 [Uranotaenia lowii]
MKALIAAVCCCVVQLWTLGSAQYFSINLGTEEESLVAQPIVQPPQAATQEVRQKITPLDAMVDKTNYLGFRLLYLHAKGNKNNIAFSPCAVGSILVALYEGANGRSASEIHEVLVVPYDKDILRVGYRDIHRRLRSYFYRKENLLSGLSLSSENITIRPEYESILKFYGYDLESIPEMKTQSTTPAIPTSPDATDDTTMFSTDYEMTSSEESQSTTEAIPSTMDWTEMGTSEQQDETESTITTEEPEANSGSGELTTENEEIGMNSTTEESTAETTETTDEAESTTEAATEGSEKRRRNLRKRGQRTSGSRRHSHSNYRVLIRTRRSPEEIDIIGHQRFLQNFLLQDATTSTPLAAFPVFSERANHQFQQERPLDDTIEHNFYLSETETVKVPYKIYNTILKYAYIERLQSTVMELELDSDDYKLIIVLPDYEFGLGNLLKLLQIGGENVPTLREIVSQMNPSWVKTLIPKFSLKGNIILTSDLQNMNINDIFEPTRADFSPMTDDPLIYAKHIEQSININIRTQSLQQLKRFTSLYKNPIELAVNYPFLFCVLDKELDLALITGRILNPLNSRIH